MKVDIWSFSSGSLWTTVLFVKPKWALHTCHNSCCSQIATAGLQLWALISTWLTYVVHLLHKTCSLSLFKFYGSGL